MRSEEYIQYLEDQGIHAKRYIVGDKVADGHDHVVYIRDDEPVATTTSTMVNDKFHHAHSIRVRKDMVMTCDTAMNHTHNNFTLSEKK